VLEENFDQLFLFGSIDNYKVNPCVTREKERHYSKTWNLISYFWAFWKKAMRFSCMPYVEKLKPLPEEYILYCSKKRNKVHS